MRWLSPGFSAAVVAAAVVGATVAWEARETQRHRAEQRAEAVHLAATLAGRLQAVFHARLSLAHGLEALVHLRHGQVSEAEFRLLARHLREQTPDIRSLQLAPDAVVRLVDPFESNRQAVGHDIRQDPARWAAAERAVLERRFVVAGPFELLQGGTAVIARLPIYLPVTGGGDMFWGFASVVLDLEPLLAVGGLTDEGSSFAFALRGRDGLGAQGGVFFGDEALFGADPALAEIGLPDGSWQLAAVPRGGWPTASPTLLAIWLGGLAFAGLSGLLTHHLLAAPQRLRLAVATATAALDASRRQAEALSVAAQRASEDKSRFLAAASHDLQQPVAALRLYLGLLEDDDLTPRTRALVPKMEMALQSATDLLASLVHTTALESGKVTPELQPIELRRLMLQVVATHQQAAKRKGLELALGHCRRRDCRGLTVSDPLLMSRILGNLVSNAVRYAHGKARVRCSCHDGYTLVFVTDTGPGIPAAKLPRIFDEYYRGQEVADKSGVGLGLAIVSRLSAALGHELVVRSREGSGTSFMLKIPHLAPEPAKGGHVLLVEDDEDHLFAAQMVLEDLGFAVTPATGADEALRQLAGMDEPPDLVVTDYWLGGGKTGADLLRGLGQCPAIILTTDTEAAKRYGPAGCTVLAKPCSARQLREAVQAVT